MGMTYHIKEELPKMAALAGFTSGFMGDLGLRYGQVIENMSSNMYAIDAGDKILNMGFEAMAVGSILGTLAYVLTKPFGNNEIKIQPQNISVGSDLKKLPPSQITQIHNDRELSDRL